MVRKEGRIHEAMHSTIPLVSFLVPSRGRFGQLIGSLASIKLTSPADARIEYLVRLDSDDSKSVHYARDLETLFGARVIIGPPNAPIAHAHGLRREISPLYNELSNLATAPWVWIWNDDAWLRGNGWYQQLEKLPVEPSLVLVESLQHHQSYYHQHAANVLPMFLRNAWEKLGMPVAPEPIDLCMVDSIRAAGWPEHHLIGTCVVHDWRSNGGGLAE